MKLRAIRFVLLLWLCSGTLLYAQGKRPCDILSKADVESAVGVPMFIEYGDRSTDDNEHCSYTNQEPFQPRHSPFLNFNVQVFHEAKPDAEKVQDTARSLKQYYHADPDPVSGLGDAALWSGNQTAGVLYVFRSGTETLVLGGSVGPEKLKALALKALGGNGKTGYAYDAARPALNPVAPEPPVVGGASFSQAVYITPRQFLKQLKEVSLTISSTPSLARHVSAAEQRDYVTKALASNGIAVRPSAAVSLLASFDELESTFRKSIIYTRGSDTEDFYVHNFFVSLDFFVRAAVVRNGKLHLLEAVPARASYENQFVEDREIRKLLFGDETKTDIKSVVSDLVMSSLKDIASSEAVDSTPWYANAWTNKEKAELTLSLSGL